MSYPGNTILVLSSLCFGASVALTGIYVFPKENVTVNAVDSKVLSYEEKIQNLEMRLSRLAHQEPKVLVSTPVPTIVSQEGEDQELKTELIQLRAENARILQEQEEARQSLAATNRVISELEFRVETHSRSFRPLKVENGNNRPNRLRQADTSRLLPPIQER